MTPHELLDTRTIVLLSALFRLSAGLVVLSFRSHGLDDDDIRRSQALWGLGNILIGLGTGSLGLRGMVPDLVSINFGNAGIILGATMTTSAYMVYAKKRDCIPISAALGLGGVVLYNVMAFSGLEQAVEFRSSVTLVALILFEVLIARTLLTGKRPSSQLMKFLVTGHVALIAPMLLRLLELYTTSATAVLASATGVWATFLGSALFSFAVTPAFILLLKEDSDRSIMAQEKKLSEQQAAAEAGRMIEREELRRQKSEQLATLARGLAHDFNHLLSIIRFSTQNRQGSPERGGPVDQTHAFQDQVALAIDQGLALTEGLMNLGKRDLTPVSINISDVIEEARRLVVPSIPSDIRATFEIDVGLFAQSNRSLLLMAVLNIIWNARDAMPGGGDLKVQVRKQRLEVEPRLRTGRIQPGACITIMIEDTGQGMDEATISQIFNADFSKTQSRNGSGLGMFMVQRFAEATGCGVGVSSLPGHGTKVIFYVPVSPEAADNPSASQRNNGADAPSVLLVDDDETTLRDIANIFCALGATVATAERGETALDAAASRPFDLVLCDICMPGMNGLELARALERNASIGTIVLMSSSANLISAADTRQRRVLKKPINRKTLEALLSTLPNTRPVSA